jgi:single-strand DNA-binding protein
MASFNKITLIGNVGNDPQMKIVGDNRKVTELSVAVNEKGRNGQPDKTEWFRVSLWDSRAEVAANYVKKGNPVYIEGRLSVRTYVDKDGRDRYSLEVLASDIQLLSGREGSEGGQAPMAAQSAGVAASAAATPVSETAPAPPVNLLKTNEEEDELPF